MRSLLFVVLLIVPSLGAAATFTVGAQSNGGFGQTITSPEPFEPLALGPSLIAGQKIVISAGGTISLIDDGSFTTDPDGIPFDFGTSTTDRSPLQEAADVFGGVEPNSGALLGYFVPEFLGPVEAFDIERGGDLPASGLFLIGSSASFEAPEPGTLFFGINDPRVSNNSGSFEVGVSEVPLPAGAWLLLSACALLAFRRRA